MPPRGVIETATLNVTFDPQNDRGDLDKIIGSLCSATYGSAYWCGSIESFCTDTPSFKEDPEGRWNRGWDGKLWYRFFTNQMDSVLILDKEEGEWHRITLGGTLNRIRENFSKTRHAIDLYEGNDDAYTGDALLQIMTFGELIYG